jgi:DnaD/phage-associated family protein
MKPFIGFSTERHRTVRVPDGFFEDVLPSITSMLEMKVTLYLFWRLARNGRSASSPRMVSLAELEADDEMRSALARCKGPRPHAEALREGLELAVARGTLLQIWVREEPTEQSEGRVEQWYMLNTRDNRTWIDALSKGQIDVEGTPLVAEEAPGSGPSNIHPQGRSRIRVVAERPSIYALYEQNVGLLTPILAERLQDAEARYPMEWVEAAFEEAVANNKRNWRYIERILERWAAEGKDNGKDRGPAERSLDPDKYTKGKYAFLFRPD